MARERIEARLARSWLLLKPGDGYMRVIILLFLFFYVLSINEAFLKCSGNYWTVCLVSDFK